MVTFGRYLEFKCVKHIPMLVRPLLNLSTNTQPGRLAKELHQIGTPLANIPDAIESGKARCKTMRGRVLLRAAFPLLSGQPVPKSAEDFE